MAGPAKQALNSRYGRLLVIKELHKKGKYRRIKCRCDCGETKVVEFSNLHSGRTQSCGCIKKTTPGNRTTHGKSGKVPEYGVWLGMRQRCNDRFGKKWPRYGGRGIIVCDEWKSDFARFYSDMGPRPSEKHSIDRIDNDGPYAPWNCRWATAVEQANNQSKRGESRLITLSSLAREFDVPCRVLYRRLKRGFALRDALTTPIGKRCTNVLVTFDGETRTIAEWSKLKNIERNALHWRIQNGWTPSKALNEPVRDYP